MAATTCKVYKEERKVKSKSLKISTKKKLIGITFVLPCTIVLLLMIVFPLLQTFTFSFSNIKLPYFELSFAGFDNFINAFSKPGILKIVGNTIVWTVSLVLLRLLLGLGSALVMSVDVKGITVLRIVALLPWIVPSIVKANIWRWMYASDFGVINGTLRTLGLNKFALNWLGSPKTALPSVIVAATWAGYPFVMMILISAIHSLPNEPFEAAKIDGANSFQLFRHITLPGIKPVLFIIIALESIFAINTFDLIFVMTGGGPVGATEIFSLLIKRLVFTSFDFGAASAVSVVLLLIPVLGFCLYTLVQRLTRGKEEF